MPTKVHKCKALYTQNQSAGTEAQGQSAQTARSPACPPPNPPPPHAWSLLARVATCSTARSSVSLMRSPPNMAPTLARSPDASARPSSSWGGARVVPGCFGVVVEPIGASREAVGRAQLVANIPRGGSSTRRPAAGRPGVSRRPRRPRRLHRLRPRLTMKITWAAPHWRLDWHLTGTLLATVQGTLTPSPPAP